METKLYVGNLSYDTTEDGLRALFSGAGTVTSVVLIRERDTGRSKGFAFVEMASENEVEQAMRMFNGATLDDREIKVDRARPQEERSTGNGGRSNRGGYGDRRGGPGGRRY